MTNELYEAVKDCENCIMSRAACFHLPPNESMPTCKLHKNVDDRNQGRGTYVPCELVINEDACPVFGLGRLLNKK